MSEDSNLTWSSWIIQAVLSDNEVFCTNLLELAKWFVNFKICKRLCISTFLQMNVKPACTHPHCSLFKWHWQMIIAVASLLTKCNDRSTFLYLNFKRHHVEKQPSHGRIYFLTIIYQSLILSPASNTLLYFRFLKYWNFKRATIIA